jgi:hypothetical protein
VLIVLIVQNHMRAVLRGAMLLDERPKDIAGNVSGTVLEMSSAQLRSAQGLRGLQKFCGVLKGTWRIWYFY